VVKRKTRICGATRRAVGQPIFAANEKERSSGTGRGRGSVYPKKETSNGKKRIEKKRGSRAHDMMFERRPRKLKKGMTCNKLDQAIQGENTGEETSRGAASLMRIRNADKGQKEAGKRKGGAVIKGTMLVGAESLAPCSCREKELKGS